jgi:hypothetical protein
VRHAREHEKALLVRVAVEEAALALQSAREGRSGDGGGAKACERLGAPACRLSPAQRPGGRAGARVSTHRSSSAALARLRAAPASSASPRPAPWPGTARASTACRRRIFRGRHASASIQAKGQWRSFLSFLAAQTECGVNGGRAAEGGNAQAPRPTEVTRGGAPEVKKKVNRRYRDALDQRGEPESAHLCCHTFRFFATFSSQLRVKHHAQTLSCTPRHILPAEMSSSTS